MIVQLLSHFAAPCPGGDFLGFPKWYKYLNGVPVPLDPNVPNGATVCTPQLNQLSDIWLIVAAVIEVLLRIAALAAVGYVIYGGVQYVTSQGEPAKTTQARNTIVNAVIGLVISVLAATIVAFIAGRFA